VGDGEVVIGAEFGSEPMWSAGLVVLVYEAGQIIRGYQTGWSTKQVLRLEVLPQPWASDSLRRIGRYAKSRHYLISTRGGRRFESSGRRIEVVIV
jgi:hypothetical protein